MSWTRFVIAIVAIVGLSVGGVGVVAADQPTMEDCDNTQSGAEFDVPEDVTEHLENDNPNVGCEDDEGPIGGGDMKGKLVIVALVIIGLSVGGVGVAVADQPTMEDCENTESGEEFDVPEDVAEELEEENPNVDCDTAVHGGR